MNLLEKRLVVRFAQLLGSVRIEFASQFPHERLQHEAAAHADAPVHAPDRKVDAGLGERLMPCDDVLIHAIDQGAVEVEDDGCGSGAHVRPFPIESCCSVCMLLLIAKRLMTAAVAVGIVASGTLPAAAAQTVIDAPLSGVAPALLTRTNARVEIDGRDVTSATTFRSNGLIVRDSAGLGEGEHVLQLRLLHGTPVERFWYFITPAETSTVAAVPFTSSLGPVAPQPFPFAAPRQSAVPAVVSAPALPAPVLYGCSLAPALAASQTCISNAPGAPIRQPGSYPVRAVPPLHPNPYVIGPPATTVQPPGH